MTAGVRKVPKHALVAERQRQMRRRGRLDELESMFGPAAVIEGEDEIAYLDFYQRVHSAVNPRDMIDEIFARELTDIQWEILRYRREQALLQRAAFRKAAIRLVSWKRPDLARILEESVRDFDLSWKGIFKSLGLTREQAQAEALPKCLEEVERLEGLIRRSQARWIALRRDSERRREMMDRVTEMVQPTLLGLPGSRPQDEGQEAAP